mgnify:CR=1 FL=1
MLTVILDNALVDILHKEVDARHGEGLLGIVADGLIDQSAAAQVELILRDLALVKERDKLIILELIPRLGADIVGEPRKEHSRYQQIRQQHEQPALCILIVLIISQLELSLL